MGTGLELGTDDYATNIAEEVIYLIEGKIVRHEKF